LGYTTWTRDSRLDSDDGVDIPRRLREKSTYHRNMYAVDSKGVLMLLGGFEAFERLVLSLYVAGLSHSSGKREEQKGEETKSKQEQTIVLLKCGDVFISWT
jgi:hypothetical protein